MEESSPAAHATNQSGKDGAQSGEPVSDVPPIKTDRLLLRAFAPADAEAVFAYSSDPRIGHDAGWPAHRSLDDSLFFIRDIASQGHVWALVPKETIRPETPQGTPIGSIGLIADPAREYDRVLMLGYAIGAEFWGRATRPKPPWRSSPMGSMHSSSLPSPAPATPGTKLRSA